MKQEGKQQYWELGLAPSQVRSAPGLFPLPPGGHNTRAFRLKARKEQTSSSWQAERWPCQLSPFLPGPRRLLWVTSECFDPEMPHLELTYHFCFVLFYIRASNLSFIPPSKVEYLHFRFDCLTNFSIVTEWLPMSNEVYGFLKGGGISFFLFSRRAFLMTSSKAINET